MPSSNSIFKYLDISTGNVTQETMEYLSNCQINGHRLPMTIAQYEYGTFVTVPSEIEDLPKEFPSDLKDVLLYAESLECTLVRLDKDGELVESLPNYNW